MTNYLLRDLNVVLISSNQNTSPIDLIVEFNTPEYGVKLHSSDETIAGQITLTYEIDPDLKTNTLFHNGFIYSNKQIDWSTNTFLNIIVIVDFSKVAEAGSMIKDENDVIKTSGAEAD